MKKRVVLVLVLLLIGFVSAFSIDDLSDFMFGKKSITGNVVNSNICGSSGVCSDLPYAASPSNGRVLKMNIHLPKNINGPWPVVVFFSPGSWVSGDRSNCYTTGSDFITPLLNRGIAVACVDYSNTNENNNPHFPEQIYEAKAAVRFLRANANNYGLNPNKIGAFGASAGGHQAAMLGTSIGEASLEGGSLGNAGVSSAIQAVVVSSGPTYFYPISQVTDGSQNGALYAYLGVDATKNPALYVTVANAADASLYVNGNEPPFLLQYGGSDTLIKPSSGQRLDSALKSKNIDSTLHIYSSWGHGDYLYGAGGFDELGEFFVRTLQPPVAAPPTPVVPVRSCGVEILRDTKFEQGFSVIEGTQSSNVACNIPSNSQPYWTLFELATNTNLCKGTNSQTSSSIIYQSGSKQLISDKNGILRMIIDTSQEENRGCKLTSNDVANWVHYYIARSYYDKSVDLGAYESLKYTVKVKLNRADHTYTCGAGDHMSVASILQLAHKSDPSKLFWINVGHCGISDSNVNCNSEVEEIVYDHLGVPLYSVPTNPSHKGSGWVNYDVDLKAVTNRAFDLYKSKTGIVLNPNDYYVSVFIPGMEVWGGYAVDVEFANMSLVGKSNFACDALPKAVPGDYDKDGKANLAVFKGDSTGSKDWYVENLGSFDYGWNGPVPVVGDYDGDNKSDFAVFNKADAKWYIAKSTGGELVTEFGWGATDPVPADYDGDGKYDLAVYYPLESKWYIKKSSDGTMLHDGLQFGWNGPNPVVGGDYDGDKKADIVLYDQAYGNWWIRQSSNGQLMSGTKINFGWNEAYPVVGDYDGDRKTDLAVYHQNTGNWYIKKSSDGTMLHEGFNFGWSSAWPVSLDYDGDKKTDLAVYWPEQSKWYIRKSSNGEIISDIKLGIDYVYTAPAPGSCTYSYSSWSSCSTNSIQTRSVVSSSPAGCSGSPQLSQPCNYIPPTCTSFTYNSWSACVNGQQATSVATSSPTGCSGGTPILTQSCISQCTDSNWIASSPSPSICPSNEQQTITYTKSGQCSGGVTKSTETISCNYQAPQCTYTVGDWEACTSVGTQSRTVSSSPVNCQGTSPQLSQPCNYVPLCTETDWSASASVCAVNNQITITYNKIGNCNGGIYHSSTETQACTYQAPQCEYVYSDWNSCSISGTQSRTIISKSPDGCQGVANLTQTCNYVPLCTDADWNFSLSSCMSNNTQVKNYNKIGNCNGGINYDSNTIVSCNYSVPSCENVSYSDWGVCTQSGTQSRTIISQSPEECNLVNVSLSQNCNYVFVDSGNGNSGGSSNSGNSIGSYSNSGDSGGGVIKKTNVTNTLGNDSGYKTIILGKRQNEKNGIQVFFIKMLCKLGNLFNSEKYNQCLLDYN